MKNVVLGISGSIAAYKAADIAFSLRKHGCGVHVMMTENATKFITPLTMQTLSGNKVHFGPISADGGDTAHIDFAKNTDLFLIVPATANLISKIACGLAGDMLTTTILALKNTPVLIAPAMNTNMYENPVIRENIEKLKRRGFKIIEPKEAVLACGDAGKGALADVDKIVSAALRELKINE